MARSSLGSDRTACAFANHVRDRMLPALPTVMQQRLHIRDVREWRKLARSWSPTRVRARCQETGFGDQEYAAQSLKNFPMPGIAIRDVGNSRTEHEVHHTDYSNHPGPKPLHWSCDGKASCTAKRSRQHGAAGKKLRHADRPRLPIPTVMIVREGQGFIGTQTGRLWQLALADWRRI